MIPTIVAMLRNAGIFPPHGSMPRFILCIEFGIVMIVSIYIVLKILLHRWKQ